MILRSGDVESNPGPDSQIFKVSTYNARGMKNRLKLKRLLNTAYKLLSENSNTIICLQETHLELNDMKTVEMMWRHKFIMSPGTNRQCGCLILFDSSWDMKFKSNDDNGRLITTVLEKFDRLFILANVYAPNDHDVNFFSTVFNKLVELQISFPSAYTILVGDFNFVSTESDAVNRITTNPELQCRNFVERNLQRLNLIDSYRSKHQKGGFTWSRGSCMSRLDMIFVSDDLAQKLTESELNWAFDDSDHALLTSSFKVQIDFPKGPGLMRINADILDNNNMLQNIRNELEFQIEQIPTSWNPHTRLEFVKSAIRSVISTTTGRKRRTDNLDQIAITEQMNKLKVVKEKLEQKEITNPILLIEINNTITTLEAEHNKYLEEQAKKLALKAQTKWYEDGERSNKYFLNIIKKRGEQKLITKLVTPTDNQLLTQTEIMNHVTSFYSKLYDRKETSDNCDELLSDLPTLDDGDREELDQPITLDELQRVINGCGDTAPGPDGIPYKVYRKLWSTVGIFLLESWKYSLTIGILPLDQRISAITLLPKQGKDLDRIENWRPITLTNCDLKIFTKLMSIRVSRVLHKLIHPSQTAYIPGRVVHDNLRLFDFYNKYCKTNNIDALLISLDAKKAFDSVSHKYMHKVLESYGFSENFIETVKLLYRDIKANIIVNGYKSVMIKILRSVKQGDALSCALFILCIDPLIRKIERNPEIKSIPIPRSRLTNISVSNKVAGFADDIGIAIKNEVNSIKNVFEDYETFSKMSGIELNIGKTEILKLNYNSLHQDFRSFPVSIKDTVIYTKESITICGICFSNNANIEYDHNIIDKITRMERQLIIWLQRPLSLEGKILIVKTFGLSQLIYSLQMCEIKSKEITDAERMIFKFLWNKKWVGTTAPDRIKRTTLKLSYDRGGLQAPDVGFLDKALKTKQFLRAMKSTHPINLVQKFQLEQIGYDDYFKCEYSKLCGSDHIIKSYQGTCNFLTDMFRKKCDSLPLPDPTTVGDSITVIASTDVLEYLMRKKELLLINRFGALAILGITSYKQLYNESLFPRTDYLGTLASYIMDFFPSAWKVALEHNNLIDSEVTYENEFPSQNLQLVSHNFVTVKTIRNTFVESLADPPHPYMNEEKFQLINVNKVNPFLLIRKFIHTPRDKFFKYRILQGDIFCNERMFRFRMTESPNCTFCSHTVEVETIKHLLWDCPRSQQVWNYVNSVVRLAYNINYINYNTVVVGSENPIPVVESIIVTALKLILVIDRSLLVSRNEVRNRIKHQFILEQNAMRNKEQAFIKRWSRLERYLFEDI